MAEFSGATIAPGDIDEVYSQTAVDLGTRIKDTDGNEYIFMNGVASTVKGSWVTYDEQHITTLLAASAKGPVAIAQAAIVASKYGWYCIWGKTLGCMAATTSDNAVTLSRETTDGYVGDVGTSGDIIYGAITRTAEADGAATTQAEFQIYYPWVDDQATAH